MNFTLPDYISNSQLNAFRRSPAHWKHYVTAKKEPTEAMIRGSYAHCIALKQPQDRFFILKEEERPQPEMTFGSKLNKAWLAEINATAEAQKKQVVDAKIITDVDKMVDALYSDSEARKFLAGEYEAKLNWSCLGLNFYGIRDISSDTYIVDLKFVQSADPRDFRRYLFREGLYRQGGMYLDGEMKGEFTGDPHKRIIFIAVEQTPPYGVSVNELDLETIMYGVNEYRMLAGNLKSCIDAEHFPSYSYRNINGSFDITLPMYHESE